MSNLDPRLEPVSGELGASIMGPRNPALEAQNPDLLASPATDAGTVPNLKFSFAMARNRLAKGGWAREVTIRELPIATTMAGVNMRLEAGGIREMHWHKEAEWGYVLAGRARVTTLDPSGANFIDERSFGAEYAGPRRVVAGIKVTTLGSGKVYLHLA